MFLTSDNGLISAIFLRNLCVQKPKPVRSLRNLCVTIDQCVVYLCSCTIVVVFELELLKSRWGNQSVDEGQFLNYFLMFVKGLHFAIAWIYMRLSNIQTEDTRVRFFFLNYNIISTFYSFWLEELIQQ